MRGVLKDENRTAECLHHAVIILSNEPAVTTEPGRTMNRDA